MGLHSQAPGAAMSLQICGDCTPSWISMRPVQVVTTGKGSRQAFFSICINYQNRKKKGNEDNWASHTFSKDCDLSQFEHIFNIYLKATKINTKVLILCHSCVKTHPDKDTNGDELREGSRWSLLGVRAGGAAFTGRNHSNPLCITSPYLSLFDSRHCQSNGVLTLGHSFSPAS